MLSAALLLFANTLLFSLRLSGGGSFPKPLSAAEEREYLQRYAQGDQEARDILIQRNLRLVAHIIKKYYTQNGDQEDLISIGRARPSSCALPSWKPSPSRAGCSIRSLPSIRR